MIVIHDFAYADLVLMDTRLRVFSKSRVQKKSGGILHSFQELLHARDGGSAFAWGNPQLIAALRRIKSYLDYGMFQPIQIAAIIALNGPYDCVQEIVEIYRQRRDALVDG